MPVHSIVEAADGPAEQLLLTVGRAGVLSCRAIDAVELETLLRLLGPPSERQRTNLKRATDIVLVEDGAGIYWPRTGEQFHITTRPMRWCASRRRSHEHRRPQARAGPTPQLARSSEAVSVRRARRSHRLGRAHRRADARPLAVRCTALGVAATAPQCDATERQEHGGRAQGRPDGVGGRPRRGGLSPSLRQSGFLFRKLARHLVASDAAFRRETMTEVELVAGGLAVSLPGDRPAMLRGLSLRHEGPAVLIVDEASRVRDELWATISPMLAAAPAAQQILLSTPAGASGEFHRAWSSDEDWERVQITADQCPRISAAHLAAERIRLGDALYRQEYFGAFVSAPGSVFDAEVLAHMFGDHTVDEPDRPASIVHGRMVDRFLH